MMENLENMASYVLDLYPRSSNSPLILMWLHWYPLNQALVPLTFCIDVSKFAKYESPICVEYMSIVCGFVCKAQGPYAEH